MTTTEWFETHGPGRDNRPLLRALRREGVIHDPAVPRDLARLRGDCRRIAACMDDDGETPPMLWSGIPYPTFFRPPTCDYFLVVSVGGTKTEFALLRLKDGELRGLDLASGQEIADADEIIRSKNETRLETPRYSSEVPTGHDMIRVIIGHLARYLAPQVEGALSQCRGMLLSWGFAHRNIRTTPRLAGGLGGIVTKMTKDQAPFNSDLRGKNVGELFRTEMEREIGWSCPVAVANDTIMALYYFLGPSWRRFHRAGLFINGTGTNFALAEPYAVRPEGYISREGEEYQPARVTGERPIRAGEVGREFFVNYETGSIELGATRTRFDLATDYQIERNALAGGNAFSQAFREITRALLTESLYGRLRRAWEEAGGDSRAGPGAPEVGRLSAGGGSPVEVGEVFGGVRVGEDEARDLRDVARAIVNRSAVHAALVLNSVTLRNGFGRGGSDGSPDLLGMEGSLWKIPGYARLVEGWWRALQVGDGLEVELHAEPSYNASLPGPLYLAAMQPDDEEMDERV